MEEDDEISDDALQLARRLAQIVISPAWPEMPLGLVLPDDARAAVRLALAEAHIHGLLLAADAVEIRATPNGLILTFPPLNVLGPGRSTRLISWERVIDVPDGRDRRWLADRLRRLADLLERAGKA